MLPKFVMMCCIWMYTWDLRFGGLIIGADATLRFGKSVCSLVTTVFLNTKLASESLQVQMKTKKFIVYGLFTLYLWVEITSFWLYSSSIPHNYHLYISKTITAVNNNVFNFLSQQPNYDVTLEWSSWLSCFSTFSMWSQPAADLSCLSFCTPNFPPNPWE